MVLCKPIRISEILGGEYRERREEGQDPGLGHTYDRYIAEKKTRQ